MHDGVIEFAFERPVTLLERCKMRLHGHVVCLLGQMAVSLE
jgi:hypothetical protein